MNSLGHNATIGLAEKSQAFALDMLKFLDQVEKRISNIDKGSKPGSNSGGSKPGSNEGSKPGNKTKPKKLASYVSTPSKFSSISFLESVIKNQGLSDNRKGSSGDYDLIEAKSLLDQKKMNQTIERERLERKRLGEILKGPKHD